jgi:hypothetical protein
MTFCIFIYFLFLKKVLVLKFYIYENEKKENSLKGKLLNKFEKKELFNGIGHFYNN